MSVSNNLCPNCGTPEAPRANVCPNCGYIGVWPPPPSGTTAPAPSPKIQWVRPNRTVLIVVLIVSVVLAGLALGALAICLNALKHIDFIAPLQGT